MASRRIERMVFPCVVDLKVGLGRGSYERGMGMMAE